MTDEYITGHTFTGEPAGGCTHVSLQDEQGQGEMCGHRAAEHADPGDSSRDHLLHTHPHDFVPQKLEPTLCDFGIEDGDPESRRVCGYPEGLHRWFAYDRYMREFMAGGQITTVGKGYAAHPSTGEPRYETASDTANRMSKNLGSALVRAADAAQYERPPMPDAARRGPVVTLIDAPVDPLGTLAVIGGIYTGQVARSKTEVSHEARRQMLADMQATVLNGPLEAIQFTFLVEGVSRSMTHQMVRNRFAFFAQESLRFAVAEDWAQEVPLPPSLLSAGEDSAVVGVWRKAMNAAEDAYAALVGAGMPAEEARGVLPHDITTRLYWTVSLRSLLAEAGKRTCTQAQFPWRAIFAGVAKAFRERAHEVPHYDMQMLDDPERLAGVSDGWQFEAFADLIRPVCYQQGKCGYMAAFDRGCTIRDRVNEHERKGEPSSEWHDIDPREWAADPSAARVVDRAVPNEQSD